MIADHFRVSRPRFGAPSDYLGCAVRAERRTARMSGEAWTRMKAIGIVAAFLALSPLGARAADGSIALSDPDRLSWQLFVELTAPADHGEKVVFETWASNEDTFTAEPKFPTTPSPKVLHFPALGGRMPTEQDGPWRR